MPFHPNCSAFGTKHTASAIASPLLLMPILLPMLALVSCADPDSTSNSDQIIEAPVPLAKTTLEPVSDDSANMLAVAPPVLENPVEQQWPTTYSAALPGSSIIPYPLYPNATKYRIGGEHGLKIVVFETTDSFHQVDEYFQKFGQQGLSRLNAERDYVRYASETDDVDPWGTHRPGIVIHQFASIDEATRLGAAPDSLTNIIMSYR